MKKVLVLCTGNSCRSIMSEALINNELANCVKAYSSGVSYSGKVSSKAKKVLEMHSLWSDKYYSKSIESVISVDYDLVVTVCSNAKDNCPIFTGRVEVIHVGFDDPDGKEFDVFLKIFYAIRDKLVPIVRDKLC